MVFKPKRVIVPQEEPEEEVLEQEQEMEEEEEVAEETVKKETTKQVKPQLTVNDVLLNHEERLKQIEATLFRLKYI